MGEGKPLRIAIEQKHLFSFILWGPPGVGKTTLARIYAKAVNAEYFELSAVSAGKEDIRKIVDIPPLLGQPKILFLDEIHRFNKAQQDYLLPFVETGKLYLIGATTENPSFEVIPALLSRCRVFVLNELAEDEMGKIIDQTRVELMKKAAKDWLATNGQRRRSPGHQHDRKYRRSFMIRLLLENLKTLQSKYLRYDKAGEEHYNTISAFIKSMRASQADAAHLLYGQDGGSRGRPFIYCPQDGDFCLRRYWLGPAHRLSCGQCRVSRLRNHRLSRMRHKPGPRRGLFMPVQKEPLRLQCFARGAKGC